MFQPDATNNDNDAQMFSVSAIETQVFTAKSLPSNEGTKNSYGLSGQTTSSAGQPVNSVGTIGQQNTGGNQNAGTIGQNSLGQKAMGSQQQPPTLGQRYVAKPFKDNIMNWSNYRKLVYQSKALSCDDKEEDWISQNKNPK